MAAARAAGAAVWSEIELAARELPNPLIGITGHQRQDHHHRAHRPPAARRGARRGGLRQPGHAPGRAGGRRGPRARGWWWSARASSSRTSSASTRGRPRCSTWPPTTSTATAAWRRYRDAKLRLFAAQEPGDLAILPRGRRGRGRRRRPATWTTGPPGPDAVAWAEGGLHVAGLGRVIGWDEVSCAAATTARTRWPRPPSPPTPASGPAALARGPRELPARAPPAGAGGRGRRGRLRQRLQGHQPGRRAVAALDAYPRGVHLIAGGRAKGTPFGPWPRPPGAPSCGRTWSGRRAPRSGEAMRAAGRPHGGVRHGRGGGRRGGRARAGRARRCCWRRAARASTSSRATRSAARPSARPPAPRARARRASRRGRGHDDRLSDDPAVAQGDHPPGERPAASS